MPYIIAWKESLSTMNVYNLECYSRSFDLTNTKCPIMYQLLHM